MQSLNENNELWNDFEIEQLEKREEYSMIDITFCCDFCCIHLD